MFLTGLQVIAKNVKMHIFMLLTPVLDFYMTVQEKNNYFYLDAQDFTYSQLVHCKSSTSVLSLATVNNYTSC